MKPVVLLLIGMTLAPAVLAADLPAGWVRAGKAPDDYVMGLDTSVRHTGSASAFVRARKETPAGFGTLMQMASAEAYRGKRVRLSAWVKSEMIDGEAWAGLWLRIDGERPQQDVLGFDNMQDRPIKGTIDWTRVAIVLDVPQEAQQMGFGVLLGGVGQVWMDDLKFEVVGLDVPVTGTSGPKRTTQGPKNLDFEE